MMVMMDFMIAPSCDNVMNNDVISPFPLLALKPVRMFSGSRDLQALQEAGHQQYRAQNRQQNHFVGLMRRESAQTPPEAERHKQHDGNHCDRNRHRDDHHADGSARNQHFPIRQQCRRVSIPWNDHRSCCEGKSSRHAIVDLGGSIDRRRVLSAGDQDLPIRQQRSCLPVTFDVHRAAGA